ncbi:uncharacterized protein LOC132257906 [Phlebotomus argentipes]|uniref:uncharacterized protein LOC132257906 n=1 Tax=Phlebotomus argentipes TaxID=94469 RepID=UPI002892F569|nr:uncharacterized protein LOC132257906 [Phlebotomus argentipes]
MPRCPRSRGDGGNETPALGVDTVQFSSVIGPCEIPAIIQKFDPDQSDCIATDSWLYEVEAAKLMYGWDEKRSVLYASMQLRGPARTWYDAEKTRLSSWSVFKKEIKDMFPTKVDATEIHYKLNRRKRARKETIIAYFHSMLALARKIKLDDDSLIRYIIKGLESEARRVVLSTQKFATPQELLHALIETEPTDYSMDSGKHGRDRSPRSPGSNQVKKEGKRTRACYGCKSKEHLIADCPEFK